VAIAAFAREVDAEEEEEAVAGAFDADTVDAGALDVGLLLLAAGVDPEVVTTRVEVDELLPLGATGVLAPLAEEPDAHVPPG